MQAFVLDDSGDESEVNIDGHGPCSTATNATNAIFRHELVEQIEHAADLDLFLKIGNFETENVNNLGHMFDKGERVCPLLLPKNDIVWIDSI